MIANALMFASEILAIARLASKIGGDVGEILNWGNEKITEFRTEDRDPTPEEWEELNSITRDLRARLHSD